MTDTLRIASGPAYLQAAFENFEYEGHAAGWRPSLWHPSRGLKQEGIQTGDLYICVPKDSGYLVVFQVGEYDRSYSPFPRVQKLSRRKTTEGDTAHEPAKECTEALKILAQEMKDK